MAYTQLTGGSGPGGDFAEGDEINDVIFTQVRDNFDDHEARIVANEGDIADHETRIDALEAAGATGAITHVGNADAAGSTVNLSTHGTIDWFTPHATTTNPPRNAVGRVKKLGDMRMLDTFRWVGSGGSIFTFSSGITISSNASDTLGPAVSTSTSQGILLASGIEIGWKMLVPADVTTRQLKFVSGSFSAEYKLTFALTDGSATPVTVTRDPGAGAGEQRVFTINFNASRPGEYLVVTMEELTNRGSTPNVSFHYATLGTP